MLRNGVSFIVNLTGKEDQVRQPKKGNEKLLESFYQALRQRAHIIIIAGCSLLMRTVVNASIRLASLFVREMILQRIHFVTVEEARHWLPPDSAPMCVGGGAAGLKATKSVCGGVWRGCQRRSCRWWNSER